MGNLCTKLQLKKLPPPPQSGVSKTGIEIRDIIARNLRMNVNNIYISDGNYLAYHYQTLREFLQHDYTNRIPYQSEKFDCDDFARVLVGREREWFHKNKHDNKASTFGQCWGDIRNSERDKTRRPHAVNFFIDANSEFWLIEPQTDILFKPTSNSSFFFACV